MALEKKPVRTHDGQIDDEWRWCAFWRAVDETLTALPPWPSDARTALCRAANEWGQERALAALVLLLAPLALWAEDYSPVIRTGKDYHP